MVIFDSYQSQICLNRERKNMFEKAELCIYMGYIWDIYEIPINADYRIFIYDQIDAQCVRAAKHLQKVEKS